MAIEVESSYTVFQSGSRIATVRSDEDSLGLVVIYFTDEVTAGSVTVTLNPEVAVAIADMIRQKVKDIEIQDAQSVIAGNATT